MNHMLGALAAKRKGNAVVLTRQPRELALIATGQATPTDGHESRAAQKCRRESTP